MALINALDLLNWMSLSNEHKSMLTTWLSFLEFWSSKLTHTIWIDVDLPPSDLLFGLPEDWANLRSHDRFLDTWKAVWFSQRFRKENYLKSRVFQILIANQFLISIACHYHWMGLEWSWHKLLVDKVNTHFFLSVKWCPKANMIRIHQQPFTCWLKGKLLLPKKGIKGTYLPGKYGSPPMVIPSRWFYFFFLEGMSPLVRISPGHTSVQFPFCCKACARSQVWFEYLLWISRGSDWRMRSISLILISWFLDFFAFFDFQKGGFCQASVRLFRNSPIQELKFGKRK